uniref:Cilia- and flagella-associated protein 36 n=1 Tax=Dermatophagoides pteronyssinus TaxID=6956 RepID=A0A6P6YME7_DERPT|nr:cilia- and flagella-associated protein 36-like isoform X2 [Dermatophagoides pteronyssinus]
MSTLDTEKDEDQSWVLDSLVGFLKSPLWSTSLNDFIDRHSIIFDPNEIEDDNVDQLIGSHMQELDINEQQFSRACQLAEGMLATKLKRILFEELWAAEDYEVFVRLMSKRNVELQLEAMEILVRKYGLVYDVFVPVGTSPKNFLSEDHILREAIVRSLNDLELEHDKDDVDDESKPNRGKVIRKNVEVDVEPNDNPPVEEESGEIDDEAEEEEAAVVKTDKETVQRDAERLVKVKQKFDQKMTEALQSAFMNDDDDDDDGDKEKVKSQVQLTQIDEDGDDESESKAKQQQKDSSMISKPGLSDEDIHKRADYLRAQRDKILKKRQKERTERISKYLIKERQSKQPPSVSLSSTGEIAESDAATTTADNNGRMLAFRKSLAARLKAEVVLGGGGVANPTSKSSNE